MGFCEVNMPTGFSCDESSEVGYDCLDNRSRVGWVSDGFGVLLRFPDGSCFNSLKCVSFEQSSILLEDLSLNSELVCPISRFEVYDNHG